MRGAAPAGHVIVTVFTYRGENVRIISAVVRVPKGKTRITIRLDEDIVEWFKRQVDRAGGNNYQSLINQVLREHIERSHALLEDTLRRVLREESHASDA